MTSSPTDGSSTSQPRPRLYSTKAPTGNKREGCYKMQGGKKKGAEKRKLGRLKRHLLDKFRHCAAPASDKHATQRPLLATGGVDLQ